MLLISEACPMYKKSEVTDVYISCDCVKNYRRGSVADI